jgi:hypothetical protein
MVTSTVVALACGTMLAIAASSSTAKSDFMHDIVVFLSGSEPVFASLPVCGLGTGESVGRA